VALDDLIEDLIGEFALRAEAVGVRLSREDCEGLPLVNIDARLIERVFENLIENALRFTPRGGTITIGCRVDGGAVETEIRDSGKGIDPRDLPQVFDRFYRARDSEKFGGSGLGLAIVKRILQLHGSDISVSSRPGTGTTFTFSLPAVPG
jgi:signal transduction histidine kinase